MASLKPEPSILSSQAVYQFQSSVVNLTSRRIIATIVSLLAILTFLTSGRLHFSLNLRSPEPYIAFEKCSVDTFLLTGLPFLSSASPIPASDFVVRRNNLAHALVADEIDAFIVEPGYTFQYYANISQTDWEVWEPEERPFLMVITPERSDHGNVVAKTTFLAPHFEEGRIRMLGMPFEEDLSIIVWEEHWNPYQTLLDEWSITGLKESRKPKVMVDEEMRDFIQRGLGKNGFDVVGLGGEVERVKQTKTNNEVEILRAVNTGTVEAVRAMRKCLVPGLTENEVMNALDNTMRAAGMDPFFDIVLFGTIPDLRSELVTYAITDENAAMPHGGPDGTKTLDADTLILIDVGAHLYGYSSDICRTFFPPFFPEPAARHASSSLSPTLKHKLDVWDTVLLAQEQASTAMQAGNSCASVDIAARSVISDAGYGSAFTHRVGHGIGIKAHESPYMNEGNVNQTLKAGMVFTIEPGIYLEGKFGVRHEDIYLVRENGVPEILTGQLAKGPWEP